ncbi:MAG: glycosyltransferase family 4 protein [Gammaproteobacteria bacterium]|nr:glycosyltransferase family 4 protein [Gammaproteobacteria bacterium]
MQLAFLLYKYFPFGGLQRDFVRIAQVCQARGHQIRVYTLSWEGEVPDGFELVMVPVKAWLNHRRYAKFTRWVQADMQRRPVDRVVGFNKMPGLDSYYAADPCYEEKARTLRKPMYRYSPRYRHFSAYERAVFDPAGHTALMMISATQMALFKQHYGTPDARFHLLPPGISPDRRAPANAAELRQIARQRLGAEFDVPADGLLLVQIGSDFHRKGLDRSIQALAALPEALRQRTRLVALGADDPGSMQALAREHGVAGQVFMPGGRKDVPDFLLASDVLLHPARQENTGTVLLEALVAGLPLLVTEVCGYAHYVLDAECGLVAPEPFSQMAFNAQLAQMLGDDEQRQRWQQNALAFADSHDLYSMPEKAADVILGEVK